LNKKVFENKAIVNKFKLQEQKMKLWKIYLPVLVLGVFLLAAFSSADDVLWVSSQKARLKKDRTASAETLSTLTLGAKLLVLDQKDRWYQVKTTDGIKGWIYRGKVDRQNPLHEKKEQKSDNVFKDFIVEMSGIDMDGEVSGSARSIRGFSSEYEVKKARGISSKAISYAQHHEIEAEYQDALDQVLGFAIRENEIDEFLKAGKIGEYAK
jgi:uncharacterized protein YgiM (DUF1202 family)